MSGISKSLAFQRPARNSREQVFVHDPLVQGVLVDDDQAIVAFGDEIAVVKLDRGRRRFARKGNRRQWSNRRRGLEGRWECWRGIGEGGFEEIRQAFAQFAAFGILDRGVDENLGTAAGTRSLPSSFSRTADITRP